MSTDAPRPLVTRLLPDEEATRALGRAVAGLLEAGDVLLLEGPLGAGKTVLVAGLAEGLEVRGRVTSPTFVLAREHRPRAAGRPGLVHVDAYRLRPEGDAAVGVEAAEALADLDLPVEGSVVAVEWGGGLGAALADSWLDLTLRRPDAGPRRADLGAVGPRWGASRRDALRRALADVPGGSGS